MPENIALSTAGITLQSCVETTAGTRPTSGYTVINGIKSIPDMNPEASSIDVTDLAETAFKKYIAGLKDTGGSLAFTANLGAQFLADWAALVEDYETGIAAGKMTWFAVVIPRLTDAFYMAVEPVPLGMPAAEVDTGLEIDAHVAPRKIAGWAAKPTT